jgi:hypothetical protein
MQGLGIFIQSLMLVLLLLFTRKPISSSTMNDIDYYDDDVVVKNYKNDNVSMDDLSIEYNIEKELVEKF